MDIKNTLKKYSRKLLKNCDAPVHIGEWFYSSPETTPDKDGNIVLVKRVCFGPLEVYEWGINADNTPYEMYQWCENEFLEDTSYRKTISWEELDTQLKSCIKSFDQKGLKEWKNAYEKALFWLESYKLKLENTK